MQQNDKIKIPNTHTQHILLRQYNERREKRARTHTVIRRNYYYVKNKLNKFSGEFT